MKTIKFFGEYGLDSGLVIIVAATRRGTVRRVAKLWQRLDTCDPSDIAGIVAQLRDIGAIVEEGIPCS